MIGTSNKTIIGIWNLVNGTYNFVASLGHTSDI